MSDHLIERVEAECALRHPTLGSVVMSVSDARRLAELARKGLEAERLRLMDEAVDRYLELCSQGAERGVCEYGEHDDDCPFDERPCLPGSGGLCHWCQMDAARRGVDYRDVEAKYESALTPKEPSDA